MKSTYFIVTALVALTLLAGACAPAATPTVAPATQAPATQAPPAAQAQATQAPASTTSSNAASGAGAATVNLGGNSQYSSFLVDGKGMSLYLYTKDTAGSGASTCYGSCATAWPPLLTTGKPVAGSGVDMSKFGTLTRTDGTTQVTYNGWPLYYFNKDKQAGDITGEGVGSVWYLISPTGDKVGG
jgi:predicted lipoprotein with Yx(FWY)xxD motif